MGNLKCCPECGSEQITDEKHGGSYLIVCRECGFAVGPYALLWKAIEKCPSGALTYELKEK